jgi:hypothetical protein
MGNAVIGAGWLCVFTPETWDQARSINFSQAALPILRAKVGSRMRPGNKIFAYVIKTKKLAGVLEVAGKATVNAEESKYGVPGQFPVIIPTSPSHIIQDGHWLDMESLVGRLKLFRGLSDKKYWSTALRTTPRELFSSDAEILDKLIRELPCQ